jgi:hypothetical protein
MPGPRGLFESINSLNETTQMMRAMRILKTRGLTHEHFFLENTIKKSILNIKLTQGPTTRNC